MNEQDLSKDKLHDWIYYRTKHLDVVASWDVLCNTYDDLRFTDQLADATRLEEFKWIIAELNKFLTRMRKEMMKCKDEQSTREYLVRNVKPTGQVNLAERKNLAFQKFRQQWIVLAIRELELMISENQMYQEDTNNGWTDSGDDRNFAGAELY